MGVNINFEVGLDRARGAGAQSAREMRADVGIALDGDADNWMILVDEKPGRLIDGDQVMAVVAESWPRRGPDCPQARGRAPR